MFLIVAMLFMLQDSGRPPGLVLPGEQSSYDQYLRNQAVSAARILSGRECEAFEVTSVSSRRVTINGGPTPAANERVVLEGCGIRHVHNIEVARFDGPTVWEARPGVAGESRTNSGLQNQFVAGMFGHALRDDELSCSNLYAVDTYIAANPGRVSFQEMPDSGTFINENSGDIRFDRSIAADLENVNIDASWVEIWKLNICTRDHVTMVVFLPHGPGRIAVRYIDMSDIPPADLPRRITN